MKTTKIVILEMTEKEFNALDVARDYLRDQYIDMDPTTAQDFTDIVHVLDDMTWHDN